MPISVFGMRSLRTDPIRCPSLSARSFGIFLSCVIGPIQLSSETAITTRQLEDCLASSALVEDSLEEKELISIIEDFLRGLSQENRVIFLRRYWFSDSYAEIAARTGLTEKNVSVRLSRIRKQLQTHLAERGVLVC